MTNSDSILWADHFNSYSIPPWLAMVILFGGFILFVLYITHSSKK